MFSLYSLLAVSIVSLLVGIGGFLAAHHGAKLHQSKTLQTLVAFATGMLMALNFGEFIPEILATAHHFSSLLIFLGILFVIVSETYLAPYFKFFSDKSGHVHSENCEHSHSHHLISHHAACSAVGCLMVCAFFDGIQINSAFMIGNNVGWLTVSALLFHILPDGALASTLAIAGGMGIKAARLVTVFTALSLWLGVIFSSLLGGLFDFNAVMLPITSGVLLYVSFVHLLPVALRAKLGIFILLLGYSVIHFGLS